VQRAASNAISKSSKPSINIEYSSAIKDKLAEKGSFVGKLTDA
jgi:hypothetical protein